VYQINNNKAIRDGRPGPAVLPVMGGGCITDHFRKIYVHISVHKNIVRMKCMFLEVYAQMRVKITLNGVFSDLDHLSNYASSERTKRETTIW